MALSRVLAYIAVAGASFGMAACARSEPIEDRLKAHFVCDSGIGFVVTFGLNRARIVTASAVYEIQERQASIGRRYSAGDIAFAQDEDRAVLIGADGGPFRNCVETRD